MTKNKQKILITGANGYIGSHVLKYLLDKDFNCIAVDFTNNNIDKRADFIKYDILKNCDSNNIYKDLKEPDILIHFAWQDGFNHNAKSHIENMDKHYKFLTNLINQGLKSLSIMGTMHEVGYVEGIIRNSSPCNPMSLYGIAKNALRQMIMLYVMDKNISLKWLRAFYIYGDDKQNHSVFTKLIEAENQGKKEFPFTDGINFYDFIHIDELSKQISEASIQNKVNGIINVCSGEPKALKEVIEDYIKYHNFKIKLNYGAFAKRKYDSPIVYGDNTIIQNILKEV